MKKFVLSKLGILLLLAQPVVAWSDEAENPAAEVNAAETSPKKRATNKVHGLLGPVTLGPAVSTGILHILNYGLEAYYKDTWGGRFNMGSFSYNGKTTDTIDSLKATISHIEVVPMYFPWQGSFFLGLAIGQEKYLINAVAKKEISSGGVKNSAKINADFEIISNYFGVDVGWVWKWGGFLLGTGVGLKIPVSSSSSFESELQDDPFLNEAVKKTTAYQQFESDVKDAGKKMGILALPRLEFIRLGYQF